MQNKFNKEKNSPQPLSLRKRGAVPLTVLFFTPLLFAREGAGQHKLSTDFGGLSLSVPEGGMSFCYAIWNEGFQEYFMKLYKKSGRGRKWWMILGRERGDTGPSFPSSSYIERVSFLKTCIRNYNIKSF
jgi:hypothetical protein